MESKNSMENIIGSKKPQKFEAETLEKTDEHEDPVWDRQQRVKGFDQETFSDLTVTLIGAGGLGGEIGEGLVRKGVGKLKIFDADLVELSNLNRQRFFEKDLYKNKALSLAKNLVEEGTQGTEIVAYPFHFSEGIGEEFDTSCDVSICAPDNDEARIFASKYFLGEAPVIFIGMDLEAIGGYVYIQEKDGPCFNCYRPNAGGGEECPSTPAVMDLTKVVSGLSLFALDSVAMGRPRDWNLFDLYLSGVMPPLVKEIERKEDCELCGGI